MKHVLRFMLVPLLVMAAVRAGYFLGYAYQSFWTPVEVFHLESKMVYLAWLAQEGRDLYPSWQAGTREPNFFGPLYFWAVGQIGRFFEADLEGLFRIGRLLTMASGLLAALVVGLVAGLRYGRGAGVVSGLLSIGAAPMLGFGVMVRPDVAADLLGFVGFVLATSRRSGGWTTWIGGAILIAAIFTKQTTALYLLAAVIALALEGRRSKAAGLLAGCGLVSAVIVGAVTATIAPHFFECLTAEGQTPFDLPEWRRTMGRLWTLGREMPLMTLAGLIVWLSPKGRDISLATLCIVVPGLSVLAALKLGADLNYFLGFRLVAALGVGALWGVLMGSQDKQNPAVSDTEPFRPAFWRSMILAVLLLATNYTLFLSLVSSFYYHAGAKTYARLIDSPIGQSKLREQHALYRIAADPILEILTDSGLVALRQRERAPFVDPWLFRMLVVNGRINPERLRLNIENKNYDWIVTSHDLDAQSYDDYTFGLPPVLAQAARKQYEFAGLIQGYSGFYLYRPRPDAADAGSLEFH